MIQFDFWKSFPVFNFADVALCVGLVLFVVYLIVYYVKAAKNGKKPAKKDDNNEQ